MTASRPLRGTGRAGAPLYLFSSAEEQFPVTLKIIPILFLPFAAAKKRRERHREIHALFLRAAALLDGLLLSYPLLAILEVSLTGQLSAPLSLPRLGIVLLSGALGAFIGWLLDRMKNPPVRAITLLLAAAPAAGFTAGCWYLMEKNIFHLALAVLCLVFYVVGMYFATHPFDELIGTSFLSLTMVAYFLAAVIVWFATRISAWTAIRFC